MQADAATTRGLGDDTDTRTSPRHSFPYCQQILPLHASASARQGRFIDVECVDLSGSGVAFLLSARPMFDELIVALGKKPELKHYRAKIIQVVQVEGPRGPLFRVGCQFIERVQVP